MALRAAGRYREAEQSAGHAAAAAGGDRGPGHVPVLCNLAGLREALGAVHEAETLHRAALKIAATGAGPDVVVSVAGGLSANLRLQGRVTDARIIAEEAAAIALAGNVNRSLVLGELGSVATEEGRFPEAEAKLATALSALGGDRATGSAAAGILQRLARLEHARGDHSQAERYIRRAGAVRGPEVSFTDPDDLADPIVLGIILCARGRVDDAEPMLRAACAVFELVAGPRSPHLLVAVEALAKVFALTKRSEAAIAAHRRVLDGRSAVFGASHPALATTLHDLAVLLDAAGRGEEAVALWDRAAVLLGDGAPADDPLDLREIAAVGRDHELT